MNHYGRSGTPGAKTQLRRPFSEPCLPIRGITFFSVSLCVKKGCVLHLLQMEDRNSLLKCFQNVGGFDSASLPLDQMPSLNTLYRLSQGREIWGSPISDIQEEGTSSSRYAPALEAHATVGPGGA